MMGLNISFIIFIGFVLLSVKLTAAMDHRNRAVFEGQILKMLSNSIKGVNITGKRTLLSVTSGIVP